MGLLYQNHVLAPPQPTGDPAPLVRIPWKSYSNVYCSRAIGSYRANIDFFLSIFSPFHCGIRCICQTYANEATLSFSLFCPGCCLHVILPATWRWKVNTLNIMFYFHQQMAGSTTCILSKQPKEDSRHNGKVWWGPLLWIDKKGPESSGYSWAQGCWTYKALYYSAFKKLLPVWNIIIYTILELLLNITKII